MQARACKGQCAVRTGQHVESCSVVVERQQSGIVEKAMWSLGVRVQRHHSLNPGGNQTSNHSATAGVGRVSYLSVLDLLRERRLGPVSDLQPTAPPSLLKSTQRSHSKPLPNGDPVDWRGRHGRDSRDMADLDLPSQIVRALHLHPPLFVRAVEALVLQLVGQSLMLRPKTKNKPPPSTRPR